MLRKPTQTVCALAAVLMLALTTALPGAPAQNGGSSTAPPDNTTFSPLPGFDKSAMDLSADPCVDFYQYACGNFSRQHPIRSDQPSFDEFTNLYEYNTQVLHGLLEQAAAAHAPLGSDQQKIGDFYASCMDTAGIEKKGVGALQPQLDAINALEDKKQLGPLLARMQKLQTGAFLDVGSQQDYADATREIAYVDQGGLGLPEKDYYLRDDAKSKQTREQYVQHLGNVLKLMGEAPAQATGDAQAVMALETALARVSMGVVARRDPKNVYHVQPVSTLTQEAPLLDPRQLLSGTGVPQVETLNVTNPDFFKGLNQVLAATDLKTIQTYLRLRLVDSEAMRLPRAFDEEHFNFYGRQLTGTPDQQARWKRCVNSTDAALGQVLGKVYVGQYFAGDSKARTQELVREIEAAMAQDLKQLDWMSPATRTRAEEKLHLIANKIGYPERWRDYSSLQIEPGDTMGNSLRAREFQVAYELNKIGKPVNRNEWLMSPPTVNAYYDPSMNDINFPAGILQPAFYDKSASQATNDGHIGSVVGHELTHGFDDQGRKFDGKGNLADWWTPQDTKNFEERSDCLVKEYGGFTAVDDLHVNGQLTLGENTADNGGLRLALMAFLARASTAGLDLSQKTDGLTPEQHLFVGWAQNWCSTQRPELVRLLVQTNEHSPDHIRANGVVVNMPEFGKAFACKQGQPMYPAKACRVW